MRNLSLLLCFVAILLVPALDARSDILDGSYTVDFTGPQSLWPLEDIDFCESENEQGVSVEICIDFSFVPDGAGGVHACMGLARGGWCAQIQRASVGSLSRVVVGGVHDRGGH